MSNMKYNIEIIEAIFSDFLHAGSILHPEWNRKASLPYFLFEPLHFPRVCSPYVHHHPCHYWSRWFLTKSIPITNATMPSTYACLHPATCLQLHVLNPTHTDNMPKSNHNLPKFTYRAENKQMLISLLLL